MSGDDETMLSSVVSLTLGTPTLQLLLSSIICPDGGIDGDDDGGMRVRSGQQ